MNNIVVIASWYNGRLTALHVALAVMFSLIALAVLTFLDGRRDPSSRRLLRPLARVFFAAMGGMAAYEGLKMFAFPRVAIWESHLMTIGVSSVVAVVVAYFVWQRQSRLLAMAAAELRERQRSEKELQRVNRALRTISECNQALVRAVEEPVLLKDICEILVRAGGYRMVWVGFAENNGSKLVRPVAHAGFEDGYLEKANITWADDERGRGPTGTAIRTGKPVVVRFIHQESSLAPWREEALKCGYISSAALPVLLPDCTLGALTIYSQDSDVFDSAEMQLLTELSGDLAYGIQASRTKAEHKRAEQSLHESERKYRELVEHANSIILRWTRDGRILFLNEFGQRFFGYTEAEICGRHVLGTIVPETESGGRDLQPLMDNIFANPATFEQVVNENTRRNGERVWIAWTNKVVADEHGQVAEILSIGTDITARKNAEEALRVREIQLRLIHDNSYEVMFAIGVEPHACFRFISVNHKFTEVTGLREDQVVGKLVQEIIPEPACALVVGKYKDAIRSRQPVHWEEVSDYPIGRKAGEVTIAPVFDAGGNCTQLIGTVHDITERKQAEEELRHSESKYRTLVETSQDVIWSVDSECRITFMSPAARRVYGYEPEELVGRPLTDLVPPEGLARELQEIERVMVEGASIGYEHIMLRKDGSPVYLSCNSVALRDEGGRLIGAMGVTTDITERKRAEEELRRNEEQLRLIMANLADLVAVLDADGTRLYNSPSYGGILGDPDKLRGSLSFNEIHPEDLERVRQAFQDTVRTGEGKRLEYRLIDRDGRPRHIESQGSVIRDAHGRVSQVVVVSRDITGRRQAEQAIRELNASLEQRVAERTAELAVARDRAEAADRTKSAFLATMSHELRTPLNSIIGFTGLLLQGLAGPLNAEQAKQLGMVKQSGQHLLALINDVLDISKIEAGQIEIANAPFDLPQSMRKVVETVTPLASEKQLPVIVQIAPDVGQITSDRRRVEQILLNLLSNAIKFTKRGEVKLMAEITSGTNRVPHPAVRISVADTGMGIKRENWDKLFQPFRQLDTGLTRQHEGTGLGLAICKRLVERLGGTITVESEWGAGSTFRFALPIHPERKS